MHTDISIIDRAEKDIVRDQIYGERIIAMWSLGMEFLFFRKYTDYCNIPET